jgi:hypothetical protein
MPRVDFPAIRLLALAEAVPLTPASPRLAHQGDQGEVGLRRGLQIGPDEAAIAMHRGVLQQRRALDRHRRQRFERGGNRGRSGLRRGQKRQRSSQNTSIPALSPDSFPQTTASAGRRKLSLNQSRQKLLREFD